MVFLIFNCLLPALSECCRTVYSGSVLFNNSDLIYVLGTPSKLGIEQMSLKQIIFFQCISILSSLHNQCLQSINSHWLQCFSKACHDFYHGPRHSTEQAGFLLDLLGSQRVLGIFTAVHHVAKSSNMLGLNLDFSFVT